jgi:tetratricopeptide (TPR) repeat protein
MNRNQPIRTYLALAAASAFGAMPCAALAATAGGLPAENSRYDECIAATELDPEQAFEEALIWRDQGGGGPAEHCVAMALLALGHAGEAAVRLDALARENRGGTQEQRSELMVQAGDAWLLARRADLAEATFSAALMLTPREAAVWAARARARAMAGEWESAESDLDAAITFDNANPEFYVLRSAARNAAGKDILATNDIHAALEIDPNFPDALAERGLMRFAAGDEDGAREDWIKVLNAVPESAAADVARSGIERMEIRLEP